MLNQKEQTLITDIQSQEEVCVKKYHELAKMACDPQLKNLFSDIEQTEQQHYDTVTQIKNGSCPTIEPGSTSAKPDMTFTCTYDSLVKSTDMEHDKFLCSDALGNEKHVASVYNTDIFEFCDTKIRDTLNHIQKEEQQHGEMIYNYMHTNGMY